MYVHTNYKNSLYSCQKDGAVVMSTTPLDHQCMGKRTNEHADCLSGWETGIDRSKS